jgi:hypothetical protein
MRKPREPAVVEHRVDDGCSVCTLGRPAYIPISSDEDGGRQ